MRRRTINIDQPAVVRRGPIKSTAPGRSKLMAMRKAAISMWSVPPKPRIKLDSTELNRIIAKRSKAPPAMVRTMPEFSRSLSCLACSFSASDSQLDWDSVQRCTGTNVPLPFASGVSANPRSRATDTVCSQLQRLEGRNLRNAWPTLLGRGVRCRPVFVGMI